jgi:hypothetical protein
MAEETRETGNEDPRYCVDLHPRHESWARISTRGSMIGFAIFLVLAGLLVLWISLWH